MHCHAVCHAAKHGVCGYCTYSGATFAATGADCGTLSNVGDDMWYSITGGAAWVEITDANDVEISSGIDVACGIRVVRRPKGSAGESKPQTISVTKADTPTAVKSTDCTTDANNDGKIKYVTDKM